MTKAKEKNGENESDVAEAKQIMGRLASMPHKPHGHAVKAVPAETRKAKKDSPRPAK